MSNTESVAIMPHENLQELAEAGLKQHIRPIINHESSVTTALFALENEIHKREEALELLKATFESTDKTSITTQDERIYRRELQRRNAQLSALTKERAELMEQYGAELLGSSLMHPALADLYPSA